MIKNIFPNKILSLKKKVIKNLISIMLIVIFVGLIYSFFLSPPDYVQGEVGSELCMFMFLHLL